MEIPKVGDLIYVPTSLYLSHGIDDVVGGRAQVIDVTEKTTGDNKMIWVKTLQHPGKKYNWGYLLRKQEELEEKFGENLAYPDPDYRIEFNMWD